MIAALIDRVAAASEGSAELDAAIGTQMGVSSHYEGDGVYLCPRYTRDMDRALELVPVGWKWSVQSGAYAQVFRTQGPWFDSNQPGHMHTPALAICVAVLRARQWMYAQEPA